MTNWFNTTSTAGKLPQPSHGCRTDETQNCLNMICLNIEHVSRIHWAEAATVKELIAIVIVVPLAERHGAALMSMGPELESHWMAFSPRGSAENSCHCVLQSQTFYASA